MAQLAKIDRTMSSYEIAEIAGARHNNVTAAIERMAEKGVLQGNCKTRPYQPPEGGRPTNVYDLTARDTYLVIATFSDEVRAKIIDRWLELEEQSKAALSAELNQARLQISLRNDQLLEQLRPQALKDAQKTLIAAANKRVSREVAQAQRHLAAGDYESVAFSLADIAFSVKNAQRLHELGELDKV